MDEQTAIERGRQAYTAWFTAYPRTHDRAGQTVEVVTRDVYEALARQREEAVDLIRELADCAGKGKPAGSTEEQVWNDRAWVIKRCRDYLDGQ